jgi:hypothetical protein
MGDDTGGMVAEQPFDIHHLVAVEDRYLDVLVRGLVEVFEERQRCLAQPFAPRRQGTHFPQVQPDRVSAGGVAFQGSPSGEFPDLAVSRGDRLVESSRDLRQGQRRGGGREAVEHGQRALRARQLAGAHARVPLP